MFINSSRYYKQKTREVVTKDGLKVAALTIRRLPFAKGSPDLVKGNDRLDLLSQRKYKDSTKFWHIADANTELQANELVKKPGRNISVPED